MLFRSAAVHVNEPELIESVERMRGERHEMEREIERLKTRLAQSQMGSLIDQARTVKDVKVLAARVEGLDRNQMRSLADSIRNKLQSCVVVLSSTENGNVAIVSAVTKDLTGRVHAGKLAGAVAQAVGGKGGGRADMAEAGGKDPAALPAALEKVYGYVDEMLQATIHAVEADTNARLGAAKASFTKESLAEAVDRRSEERRVGKECRL